MKVTVIIPLYNGMKYVDDLLNMLEKNRYNLNPKIEMEVIFVKDSLENFDVEIFYKEYGFNVILLQNDRNYGIQYSRVRGIKNATGEFIYMLDQDDKIIDDFLEEGIKKIGNSDVIVFNGKKQYADYYKILYKYYFMHITVKFSWFYTKFSCRILSPGQCIIRKDSIPEIWLNNILTNSGADDALLWLIMLQNNAKFKVCRKIGYIHINTQNNLSLDTEKMKESTREMIELCKRTECISKSSILRMERKLRSNKKSKLVSFVENVNKER